MGPLELNVYVTAGGLRPPDPPSTLFSLPLPIFITYDISAFPWYMIRDEPIEWHDIINDVII